MAESFPNECSATGQTCAMGPHGYDGEIQCEFCGKPAHEPLDPAAKALGVSRHLLTAVAEAEASPNYAAAIEQQTLLDVRRPDIVPPLQVLPMHGQPPSRKEVDALAKDAKSLSKETQKVVSDAAAQAKKARSSFKRYRRKLEGNHYEYGLLGVSIGKPRFVEPVTCQASVTDCIEGSANACRETQFTHVPLACAFYTTRRPGKRALYIKSGRFTAILISTESDELPDDGVRKIQFSREAKVFVAPHTQIIVTN